MRKKHLFLSMILLGLCSASLQAQTSLEQVLPLLQKYRRTPEENQQVLQLFRTAADANIVFAAGASLVRIPPQKIQEPALFNLLLRSEDELKRTFTAVILTAMGSAHTELLTFLTGGLNGKDPVLRAYCAGAYALITPGEKNYTDDIVRLYAFDPAFAQRAMNAVTADSDELFRYTKQALFAADAQTRAAAAAWLGEQRTPQAVQLLLKRAKKETDVSVTTQLSTALAKNRDLALEGTAKNLNRNYKTPQASTYALALGLMTGHAVETLRKGILDSRRNVRINSARAAAYMASVFSTPDSFVYSQDRTFDIRLLKSLILPLKTLEASNDKDENLYAQQALLQIEKLME